MAIGEVGNVTPSQQSNIPIFPSRAEAVTPSDTATFDGPVAVRVNVAGNLVVTPQHSDVDVTFVLAVGEFCPVMVRAVKAAGTTATGIIAVW